MVVGIFILILMSYVAIYGMIKCDYRTVNVLTIFIVFQNFTLVLISPYINETIYNVILLIKEFYVVLVIIYSFRGKRYLQKFDIGCYLCILILLALTLVHYQGTLMSRWSSFRQLYLPFLFFLFGRNLLLTREEIDKVLKFFVKIFFIAAIFGLVEVVLPDSIWRNLQIEQYWKFKGFSDWLFNNKVFPGNYYSYDFYPIIPAIRRMGSFLFDPVIFGQILAVALIFVLFYNNITNSTQKKIKYTVVLSIALLLTITKGGILIATICFLILGDKLWKKKIFSKLMFVALSGVAIIYMFFALTHNLSVSRHIQGLVEGINILKTSIWGIGVGGIGNMSSLYGEFATSTGMGESFIGAAIGQIGIGAIIIYFYFYYNMLKKLGRNKTKLSTIVLWLNVILLITAFVNNTAISYTSCYIYYILAGCCVEYKDNSEKNVKEKGIEI